MLLISHCVGHPSVLGFVFASADTRWCQTQHFLKIQFQPHFFWIMKTSYMQIRLQMKLNDIEINFKLVIVVDYVEKVYLILSNNSKRTIGQRTVIAKECTLMLHGTPYIMASTPEWTISPRGQSGWLLSYDWFFIAFWHTCLSFQLCAWDLGGLKSMLHKFNILFLVKMYVSFVVLVLQYIQVQL